MSGLELIKCASDEFSNILFVVISGYAEFSYAQKAMNYGALGYCLKPFEENEIISVLLKAQGMLDITRATHEIKLLELLEDKSKDGLENAIKVFEALGFKYDRSNKILVVVSIGPGKLTLPKHIKCINLKIGNNKNAYLLEYNKISPINELLDEKIPCHIKGIGTCLANCSFEEIKLAIEEALVAANQFFISGRVGFYESSAQDQEELNKSILQLEKAIDSKDSTKIRKVLDSIESLLVVNTFGIRLAFRIYNMIMAFLYRLDSVKYETYIYSYEQLTDQYQDVHDMLTYLKEMLSKQINIGNDNIHEDITNETFRTILGYVNENYCRNISIQSISRQFSIRPNYVSQLFKKELDITFTDHFDQIAYIVCLQSAKDNKPGCE